MASAHSNGAHVTASMRDVRANENSDARMTRDKSGDENSNARRMRDKGENWSLKLGDYTENNKDFAGLKEV